MRTWVSQPFLQVDQVLVLKILTPHKIDVDHHSTVLWNINPVFSKTMEPEHETGDHDITQDVKLSSARTKRREGFFSEFASRARSRIREICPDQPPLILLTGGFRTRTGMAAAVKAGHTDLIGIGRPACLDPCIASRILDPAIPHAGCSDAPIPGTRFWKILFPVNLMGAGFSTVWWVWLIIFQLLSRTLYYVD